MTPAPDKADLGVLLVNSRVVILRSALEGDSRLSVQEHFMPFGEAPPTHRHDSEDEIFVILDGALRFQVGDREIWGRTGDTIVAPKGVPHAFRVESEGGAHCLVMTPGPDFEGFVREASRPALTTELAPPTPPTPAQAQALAEAGARHRIEILGPPLAALGEATLGPAT